MTTLNDNTTLHHTILHYTSPYTLAVRFTIKTQQFPTLRYSQRYTLNTILHSELKKKVSITPILCNTTIALGKFTNKYCIVDWTNHSRQKSKCMQYSVLKCNSAVQWSAFQKCMLVQCSTDYSAVQQCISVLCRSAVQCCVAVHCSTVQYCLGVQYSALQ